MKHKWKYLINTTTTTKWARATYNIILNEIVFSFQRKTTNRIEKPKETKPCGRKSSLKHNNKQTAKHTILSKKIKKAFVLKIMQAQNETKKIVFISHYISGEDYRGDHPFTELTHVHLRSHKDLL